MDGVEVRIEAQDEAEPLSGLAIGDGPDSSTCVNEGRIFTENVATPVAWSEQHPSVHLPRRWRAFEHSGHPGVGTSQRLKGSAKKVEPTPRVFI